MIQQHSKKIGVAVMGIILAFMGYYMVANKPVPRSLPVNAIEPLPINLEEDYINPAPKVESRPGWVKLTDKANLFSVEIPTDWKVQLNQVEGLLGEQFFHSEIYGKSSDWHVDEASTGLDTSVHIETGIDFHFEAYHSVDVCNRERGLTSISRELVRTEDVDIGGMSGTLTIEQENVPPREVLVLLATVLRGTNCHAFQVVYNPTTYLHGESAFRQILNSIRFTK